MEQLTRKLTYADSGVDRELRAKSKGALGMLKSTYTYSKYGKLVELPYGRVFPFHDRYLDLQIEGVGTKVLVAQIMEKYDTIGIDAIAMVVNDVIRSGATPLAVADNIHAQVSDPFLVKEWMKGVVRGAEESECMIPAGEIGDVADLISGLRAHKGFDLVCAAIGEVTKERLVSGRRIKSGDSIIGMRSSGIHSNGVSLARKVLFKEWGGKYPANASPESLDREVGSEVLEPTRIYVKPFLRVAEKLEIKGAVHITGDAYLKFKSLRKFSPRIGFEFNNFKPQPIFRLIQQTAAKLSAAITDEEMFKTFNMGWGFAIIVDKSARDEALDILEQTGMGSEQIGNVNSSEKVKIVNEGKSIILD